MKFNMKKAMSDAKDVGAMAAGVVASRKWLDPDVLFKDKIAKDPAFKEKLVYKHWGAVKMGGALIANQMFGSKLPPIARMILIGAALDGAVQEAGVISTNKDGQRSFPLGNAYQGRNYDQAQLDELLRKAIKSRVNLNGRSVSEQYPTGVNGPSVDLEEDSGTGVNGLGMRRFNQSMY